MIVKNKVEHELKFIISNAHSKVIVEWLNRYCKTDPEFPIGLISSIYYDTPNWKYLDEKFNSFYFKTKVRLRWYSDLAYKYHYDAAFIEVKYKVGGRRFKSRIKAPFTGHQIATIPLEDTRLLQIPFLLSNKGIVINETLLPAFQITYKRFRYIDPLSGSRICFDFDIYSPRTNKHMLPYIKSTMLQTAVFEVKGKESELPPSLYPLTDLGLKKSSFSKYSACYQKLTRRHY
ncbi:MAG: VTC domain-containing protein [Spirochaetota bacterium]